MHSRTSASECRHTHNTHTQTLAPRPTSQYCNYAVHFASPPPLTAASVDRILMDFQPRFQIRIPAGLLVPPSSARPAAAVHRSWTKVQREKTASDAYPQPCSGDEWESHLLSACIWKPDLSAGSRRAALHISPTPLWQHAPHFCRITSAFIWSTPHSLPVYFLLLSFTSFNTVSVQ